MAHFLKRLFRPKSAAIVGASSDPDKLSGRPVGHNIDLRFPGTLHLVNASLPQVQGLPAVPSVEAIEGPVDCAVIALPAAAVEGAVRACGRKGIGVAVVFASGFAEFDAAGAQRQARLIEVAREAGVRLLGPNSMGALSLDGRFSATFTSINRHFGGKGWPRHGVVGVASQSGAVGTQILMNLRERGTGISHWIAPGNQCDIDVADAVAFYAQDGATRVIALYIEGVFDGPKFIAALELARQNRKPVVVLKVGRSRRGMAAVASHTASLVGEDAVFDAVFARYDVIRVHALDAFVDIVTACATGIYPWGFGGPGVGIVSISGGVGVLMADAAEACGLPLPELSPAARSRIREVSPFSSPGNPTDTGAVGMSDVAVDIALADITLGECPACILFLAHLGLTERFMNEIGRGLFALREKYPDQVIAVVISTSREWVHALQEKGILAFDDPTRAVETLAVLRRASAITSPAVFRLRSDPPLQPPALPSPATGMSGEAAARRLIAAIGIPTVTDILAQSAEQAVQAARDIGGAVALKIASPDIAHKSDVGGVALGLSDEAAVAAAYARILENVTAQAPAARIDGILVSPMIEGGIETIIGVRRDPTFGPVMMFGIGGLFVEILKDTQLRLAPLGVAAATEMIESIAAYSLLAGARGREPGDIDALAQALSRLSAYAVAFRDDFDSIEINPLIVLPKGRGVMAVDALVVPRHRGSEHG